MDLAYFPIQFKVIDIVSKIEKRGEFAYILNHEAGLYAGRLLGAGTFLILAYSISTEIALRYAIVIVAILQLYSIFLAKKIIVAGSLLSLEEPENNVKIVGEVAETML